MTILCIESSTSVCSAAITVDGKPYKQCICREGSNHARLLPRYIEELLRYAAEQHLSVDAVALSEGPGSYTGLRIGAATAKGLCYGLNVPLIPVPTLQVLCEAFRRQQSDLSSQMSEVSRQMSDVRSQMSEVSGQPSDVRSQMSDVRSQMSEVSGQPSVLLCPMIDARRMEVYTAIYDSESKVESQKSKAQSQESKAESRKSKVETQKSKAESRKSQEECVRAVVVESEESLLKGQGDEVQSAKQYYYFGDGAAKCQAVLTGANWHFVPDIVPEAQYMGGIVESQKSKGAYEHSGTCTMWKVEGADLAYYEPFYLKEFVAAQSHVKGLKP